MSEFEENVLKVRFHMETGYDPDSWIHKKDYHQWLVDLIEKSMNPGLIIQLPELSEEQKKSFINDWKKISRKLPLQSFNRRDMVPIQISGAIAGKIKRSHMEGNVRVIDEMTIDSSSIDIIPEGEYKGYINQD